MLYKILHDLKDDKPRSKISKKGGKTLKKNTSGPVKGGGKKTRKNKPLSIRNSKTKINDEKKYRQRQTKQRRETMKINTQ